MNSSLSSTSRPLSSSAPLPRRQFLKKAALASGLAAYPGGLTRWLTGAPPNAARTEWGPTEQRLDGAWLIALDPQNIGLAKRWFAKDSYPVSTARQISVPGNIWEVHPKYNGIAWYARNFVTSLFWSRQLRYYLSFGACCYSCDVWLNGTHLGNHVGAEAPFEFDASNALTPSENWLVLRVNSPLGFILGGSNDRPVVWGTGGLLQHVDLSSHPRIRILDIFIRSDWKTGTANLSVTFDNATTQASAVILDVLIRPRAGGSAVTMKDSVKIPPGKSVRALELTVPAHRLWSLEDPFLYSLWLSAHSSAGTDVYTVPRFGFREFTINCDGYFSLNGKRLLVKSTHGNVFDPIAIEASSRDLARLKLTFPRLKQAGFNMFREIVYAALPEQLDMADDLGFLIYNEHQASWIMQNPQKFALGLPGLIRRSRNHPSLVIWGLLNEAGANRFDNRQIVKSAQHFLPILRSLDDTRLVLFSSGRWDQLFTVGAASRPRSHKFDCYLGGESPHEPVSLGTFSDFEGVWNLNGAYSDGAGDAHIYEPYPTSLEFAREMLHLGARTGPFFVSEAGQGSIYDALGAQRLMKAANAPKDAYLSTETINPGVRAIREVWAKYHLYDTYPNIEQMIRASQESAAVQRALFLSCIRANGKVMGHNVTDLTDTFGSGGGIMDSFRNFKAGYFDMFTNAWAKVRWCLFVDPRCAYADEVLRVRAILANEDMLAPGKYQARVSIAREGTELWSTSATVPIQKGSNPPLAYPVLDASVFIPGLREGRYVMTAALEGTTKPAADHLSFYVFDRVQHANLEGISVTVLGIPASVRDMLTDRKVRLRDYAMDASFDHDVIFVGPEGFKLASTWRDLYRRIASGAHAIFLDPGVFRSNTRENAWLALDRKGSLAGRLQPSIYHGEIVAKKSAIMDGLPHGLLTPATYGQLLRGVRFFRDIQVPDEPQLVWIDAASPHFFDEGVVIGTYYYHAGRFTLNTLDLIGNQGNPTADRILVNLVKYAAITARPSQPLPVDYETESQKLGA